MISHASRLAFSVRSRRMRLRRIETKRQQKQRLGPRKDSALECAGGPSQPCIPPAFLSGLRVSVIGQLFGGAKGLAPMRALPLPFPATAHCLESENRKSTSCRGCASWHPKLSVKVRRMFFYGVRRASLLGEPRFNFCVRRLSRSFAQSFALPCEIPRPGR
jgi:hypothetical protein